MLKSILCAICFVALLQGSAAWAVPILTMDGSSVTGVDGLEVNGSIYDVIFGEGIVGDVYAGVTFDAFREAEANAVSAALIPVLNNFGVAPKDIAGCSNKFCQLFNPDTLRQGVEYIDNTMTVCLDCSMWQAGGNLGLYATTDTFFRNATLVRYQTPAPATLILIGLGLAGVGVSRRR
ncbi:Uncharacterised protein [Halioglobus japonicus]|nr:Uncharacterised protein [Halioglobus japonicus]